MEVHEFDPVIYPYLVWVVIGKTTNIITDTFNSYECKPIKDLEEDTKNLNAFAMPVAHKNNSSYGVVLYFKSKKSMSYEIVAHEASHAAKYLFDHIGADVSHHEPFEYVIGWIARCCEEVKRYKANGKIGRK